MLAFSGATAHRNMASTEDVDLFMVVEHGKVWFAFLTAILWARLRGVRKTLCINYVLGDRALPLFDHDAFTAQQMASLKPLYGKDCYDRFLSANPFVGRHFPNFTARRHREMYAELSASKWKGRLELLLRLGPAQILERVSRAVLGWHLRRKVTRAVAGASDAIIEPQRLKLHSMRHKP
jgi:hypothetical protein